ncbi:zinc ribbon domain-containing protein [Tuanshanicoccus lijuaniae]|uniref:zinc ribbon domain-containing protein n=1 Tax=Aerococcaceae bacterium zg-1292 TaxID=2774330 RepID=UPI00406463CD
MIYLAKNYQLSESIGDVSWSKCVRMLEYKSEYYEKQVSTITCWHLSSQLCLDCGCYSGKKDLSI